jgi:hypothetical protein
MPRAPRPFLFVLPHCERPFQGSSRHALGSVDEAVVGRGPERRAHREVDAGRWRLCLRLPDP